MEVKFNKHYSDEEKEQIFIERTKSKYPLVWDHYCRHISHEKMNEEELQEYNFEQRKKIVKYAYENTIFYRRLYDNAGFCPDDLKTEDDWNHMPIVTKQMVRDNFDEMIAGGLGGELARKYGYKVQTGGVYR